MDTEKSTKVNMRGQRDLKRESKINEATFIKPFSEKIATNLDLHGFCSIEALLKYLDKTFASNLNANLVYIYNLPTEKEPYDLIAKAL